MPIVNSAQFSGNNWEFDPRNVPTRKAEANWMHAKKTLLGFAQGDVGAKSEQKGQDGDGEGDDGGSD